MRFAFQITLLLTSTIAFFGQNQTPTPTPASESIQEEVVVIADRTSVRVGDTPASVSVLSSDDLKATAAPTIDEALRQTVGFSTFRRSGSRTSNPTTQGISFRGVGSSGASRAVVLFDGVPLNDPFGGWVQWQRVPSVAIDQVEVLRGGASGIYGDYSLSGAVNIIPRKVAERNAFSAEAFGGMQNTFSGSIFAGTTALGLTIDGTAVVFQTQGFIALDAASRGIVDAAAGVRSSSLSMRAGRKFGGGEIYFRPSIFGEVRTNGTGLQTNRTHIRQLIVGGSVLSGPVYSWRLYGGSQVYDQVFSSINSLRTVDSLLRIQRVPAANLGGSFVVSGTTGNHSLVAGFEGRRVNGSSDETGFASSVGTTMIGSGGRETTFGWFLRDLVKLGSKVVIVAGGRFDRWTNERGLVVSRNLSNNLVVPNIFGDRSESAFSPQAAILYRINAEFSAYASASSSFRTPTLNELYRAFRVGNVNTLANAGLRAERAVNAEGGVNFKRKDFAIRTSTFITTVSRAISNVTLASTASLITRQRQNAGQTRSAGIEIEAEAMIRSFNLSAGYLFADSRVIKFPSGPSLVGLRVPQVARHQFTFQLARSFGKWNAAAQGRVSGQQFDDDLNQFRLERYFQLDLTASRKVGESLSIFAAVENVTNSRYSTARTPLRSVSSPINFRAGFRWN